MSIQILVFAGLLVMAIGFIIVACIIEKLEYNNGVCRKCGGYMKFAGYSTMDDRCYICERCGRMVWVSYFRGDEDKEEE